MLAQKHCKNIAFNSSDVFLLFAGSISVFLFVFSSSKKFSDMESIGKYRFPKNHSLEVFLKISISRLFSINIEKNNFLAVLGSLPIFCLPVIFSAESEMFRNVLH